MEFEVIFTHFAVEDLKKIEKYLTDQGARDATKFRANLAQAAENLNRFPPRGSLLRSEPEIRYLVCGNYLIVYRILRENLIVQILRYWHATRDVRRWRF